MFKKITNKEVASLMDLKENVCMKSLLYISFEDSFDMSSGVNKKICNQIQVFSEAGFNVTQISRYKFGITRRNEENESVFFNNNKNGSKRIRMLLCNYVSKLSEKFDVCYLRFQFFCPFVKRMLKRMYKNGTLVIVEIPTYPYEQELKGQGIKGWIKLIIDRIYRHSCARYIDRFAIVLRDDPLYNVKCINIKNGVNVNDIKRRIYIKNDDSDSINFIAVALMAPWHGYDRFIEGMHTYYKNGGTRKVILHLVGEGVENSRYKKLVDKYGLNNNVIFHGKLSGEKLDELYNKVDIGVSVLAGFRKNLIKESNLKSVEYCAKGLPVICTRSDTTFDRNFTYKHIVPSDETEIDIKEVIDFFDFVISNKDREEIDEYIRNYAYNNCDIRKTFNNVVEYISNNL